MPTAGSQHVIGPKIRRIAVHKAAIYYFLPGYPEAQQHEGSIFTTEATSNGNRSGF